MSVFIIPLARTANQSFTVLINGVQVDISLHTRFNEELYISISIDGEDVINNRICRDRTKLINRNIEALNGDFVFIDTKNKLDPHWKELNNRFILVWSDFNEFQ